MLGSQIRDPNMLNEKAVGREKHPPQPCTAPPPHPQLGVA